jgi:flagellar motor protein MotB
MRRNTYSRHFKQTTIDSENPYWVSFSDIMAGLLVVFILALILLMIRLNNQTIIKENLRKQVEKALKELAAIEEVRKEILYEIKNNLETRGVHVEIVENNTVLSIPEKLSFDSGRYAIPREKENTVLLIGKEIKKALLRAGRIQNIDTIFIEGHTDSVPYNRVELGNWGLSAHRAISIWNYWTEIPGELSEFKNMKNRNGKHLFSVSGYSWTRRAVEPDVTPGDKEKNRRIDIRFTMRTPVAGELQKLLERLRE